MRRPSGAVHTGIGQMCEEKYEGKRVKKAEAIVRATRTRINKLLSFTEFTPPPLTIFVHLSQFDPAKRSGEINFTLLIQKENRFF
jgi:hypothetical protein